MFDRCDLTSFTILLVRRQEVPCSRDVSKLRVPTGNPVMTPRSIASSSTQRIDSTSKLHRPHKQHTFNLTSLMVCDNHGHLLWFESVPNVDRGSGSPGSHARIPQRYASAVPGGLKLKCMIQIALF